MSKREDDPGFVLFYEGCDPRLKAPFCVGCNMKKKDEIVLLSARENKQQSLKQCSGCKLVYYCSRDCQVEDWKNHKQLCKKFKKLRANVAHEASKIQTALMNPDLVGHFWNHEVGFTYLKAKFDLALELHPVAYNLNILRHWEEIIRHVQQVLRLGHLNIGDDLGANVKFPLYLINLGHLDKAYSVCRYMIRRQSESSQTDLEIQKGTMEGDWMYPCEPHCRFNDIQEDCPEADLTTMHEHHLVAIWLIKRKIMSMAYVAEKAWLWFLETDFGEQFNEHMDVGFEIMGFLYDRGSCQTWQDFRRQFCAQDAQLTRISDIIDGVNPHIFPFMIEFCQEQNLRQRTYDDGEDKFFAWAAVNDCSYSLLTLPGLQDWLIQFMGRRGERR